MGLLMNIKNIINKDKVDNHHIDKVYNFDVIDYYYRYKKDKDSDIISDKTIDDIDFYEVYKYIDYTKSTVGQQFYFNKLLTTNHNNNNFDEQEEWIDYLSNNHDIRTLIQDIISRINSNESYRIPNLFLDEYVSKPKYFYILKLLVILPLILFLLTFISSGFYFLMAFSIVINLILHYKNKKYIYLYKDSIPELLNLHKCAKDLYDLDILKNDIHLLSSIKSIDRIKSRMFVFKIEKVGDSDIFEIFFLIVEYIKIVFLLEPLIVFNVLDKLNEKKDDIKKLFDYVGKIDSYISILSMREKIEYYCIPEVLNKNKTLKFVDIYHPLILNCVPNTLEIERKSVLLTGSNMAGKTTFIRSVALNVLLAQTINTCFAKEFKFCPMKLYSAIRISDDLLNDKSYYFEEVMTIKDMIVQSRKQCGHLFLLDEIFKGTNTIERISAGKAVLSYLTKSDNNIVFVSTHDVELTDLLESEYDLYHFTEVIKNNQIHFDYKLKKGYLSTRNAIRILEINNYPQEIIADARETSVIIKHYSKNIQLKIDNNENSAY